MHPRSEGQEESHQARQTPLQAPQPYRDHVRQAQRLAAGCDQIRQVPHRPPLGHSTRRNSPLLALKLMSLEPTARNSRTGPRTLSPRTSCCSGSQRKPASSFYPDAALAHSIPRGALRSRISTNTNTNMRRLGARCAKWRQTTMRAGRPKPEPP